MEKTMLGHAGFLTSLKKSALSGMIEVVKGPPRIMSTPQRESFGSMPLAPGSLSIPTATL
jgi:hypothetical protein